MDSNSLSSFLAIIVGFAVALAPVVAFFVALIKTVAGDKLGPRYYPLVSVAVGVVLAFAIPYSGATGVYPLAMAPLIGSLAGGVASGLFDYGKSKEAPTS